jgi:hypothetical protein
MFFIDAPSVCCFKTSLLGWPVWFGLVFAFLVQGTSRVICGSTPGTGASNGRSHWRLGRALRSRWRLGRAPRGRAGRRGGAAHRAGLYFKDYFLQRTGRSNGGGGTEGPRKGPGVPGMRSVHLQRIRIAFASFEFA